MNLFMKLDVLFICDVCGQPVRLVIRPDPMDDAAPAGGKLVTVLHDGCARPIVTVGKANVAA